MNCHACNKDTNTFYFVSITPSISIQEIKGIAGKTFYQNLRICEECITPTLLNWAAKKEKSEIRVDL